MRSIKALCFIMLLSLSVVGLAQETTPDITPEVTSEITSEPANILIPQRIVESDGITITYYFSQIKQGRVALLQITGAVGSVQVIAFNKQQPVFVLPNYEGYFAFVVADMDQTPRTYDVIYRLGHVDGTSLELTDRINIVSGGFIQQNVVLSEDRLELINPEVETAELAKIFELAVPATPEILWDDAGFIPPMSTDLTSPFGAVRIFNETFNTRHTGWDFQASIGQPIATSASGEVVFTGQLPIRGNYILIHHGQGIYSGYAHLSVIHVTQGQSVKAGQFIGQVGSTGRSSSAHAHVEFVANGSWVDAADIIRLGIPSPVSTTNP